MKKKMIALLLAAVCIILPVVGCGKDECTSHTDENKDGKCDKCRVAVECEICVDDNLDYTCDVCGKGIECELHEDADTDLVCDKCKATLTAPCDPHKDENADRVCDICKGAIVINTIYNAPKEETRIPMVVNKPATGVAIGTYLDTSPEGIPALKGELLDKGTLQDHFYYTFAIDEASGMLRHTLTNLLTDKVVYERMDTESETKTELLSVQLHERYFLVNVKTYLLEGDPALGMGDAPDPDNRQWILYTDCNYYYFYNEESVMASFAMDTIVGEEPKTADIQTESLNNDLLLVDADEVCYILDGTEVLFGGIDAKTFVDRPSFFAKSDDYGYSQKNNKIYVYDLTKWLNCVYSYEIPSYYVNPQTALLENGTLLLHASVQLPDGAVSYDYLDNGKKYDLIYVILDPAKKTAEAVEFGYAIAWMVALDGFSVLNERALNYAVVSPIVDDRIDTNIVKAFVVDNSMKILYDLSETLKAFDGAQTIELVAENLFMIITDLGQNSTVRAIYNEKGEFICYLPQTAVLHDGFVKYDGRYYSYKMELLLDPADLGYTVEKEYEEYLILKKQDDLGIDRYYFYNGIGAPALIDKENASVIQSDADHFTVKYTLTSTVAGVPTVDTVYAFYDADNHHVVDLSAPHVNIIPLDEKTDRYLIIDTIGKLYLVK
ncbi:MAG: hypothetical protein IKA76_08555 [Clostridia bacterium]|nr:hypothetical protein [Clostridia bacterium]